MKRFQVGIDLGTTHTVVAFAEAGGGDIRLFDIEQLVGPGEVQALPLLPSLRFHPAAGELAAGALRLPWSAQDEGLVIGMLARRLGAQVPGRLVTSAKSWLSHAAVDRLAPILPWGAPAEVPRVSPVEASASYLAHVRAAWNWRFPDAPLAQQDLVLTVPASFDEAARALTLQAARDAGLPGVRLLEEPQAAFYDWLHRQGGQLAAQLADARLVLVCDVGGGTTDLSLIRVEQGDAGPVLTRIGVGKHLMLGGDNMDLVLAHLAEQRLRQDGASGQPLSAARLSQLIERCRAAKETLLAANAPERAAVTLLGMGSRLVGGASTVELGRDEVERAIVDGFFPPAAFGERPRARRSGIVEFGLPYASDPAVTRHLADFLAQYQDAARDALGDRAPADGPALPDTLLLNGGVFRAPAIAQRLQRTLDGWRGQPLRLLHNADPDVAVARGAVAYALAAAGRAPRIGGGSARSYFLALDEQKAVCVLPRGSEPGHELLLADRGFALRVGQPVRFRLLTSSADPGNRPPAPGELVNIAGADYAPLPPIAAALRSDAGSKEVRVQLASMLTEVGTLEMHCVSLDDPARRWLLEFQLRGDAADEQAPQEVALPPRTADAVALIDRIFGPRAQKTTPKEVRQLRMQLERVLGERERWPTPLLRHLCDALLQRARGRRRSADHEKAWFNLAGYCLRPGFGYPADDWRIGRLWPLFESGIQHGKDNQVASEWWTMWRRVAGGLEREAQLRLLDDFAFNVAEEAERGPRPPHLVPGAIDDMLRLAGALERIPAGYKVEIGDWLLGLLSGQAGAPDSLVLWCLARVGARQPFHGSAHDVAPPEDAGRWLEQVLALDWKRVDGAAFAAAHIGRMTGDRARDIEGMLRQRLLARLVASGAPPAWTAMVRETVTLDEAAESRLLGDSLPAGLRLIR
ncbi:Hsp70 family protein [Noviherbaspirillum aridicola]|uniref:Heat-shock protein n=1 Tax=Noviherbaspirillum aridicola TaxID=2849687 RepID=A0ABQ4PZC9_9BURK|nr:Hsp70 family protein [Noviherbaspirillum aridicola]GIZ50219.1 heat-shock protein [Noviherbaspirillum aridicola]